MQIRTNKARIIIAIKAIRTSKKLSCRAAAKIYKVPESTLHDRMISWTSISELRPGASKLTELEEDVIVRNIFDIDTREFAPWLAGVEDMANFTLNSRGGKRVRELWAYRFIQWQIALKTRFNRVYNLQRPYAKILNSLALGFDWFQICERNMVFGTAISTSSMKPGLW